MKNKLMILVGLIMTMTSAQADIWLDGQLTDADLFDYNSEVEAGEDVDGIYEFGGNYFDTLVDTAVNLQTRVLFQDGYDRSFYTDTGATTLYQTRENSTLASVMQYYTAGEKRDIGYSGEEITVDFGKIKVTYFELKNGKYRSSLDIAYDDAGNTMREVNTNGSRSFKDYTKGDVNWAANGRKQTVNNKWVGITEQDIYELNKDKFEYTVARGMNKGQIADAMGITMKELYDANPGLYGRFMQIGEVLSSGRLENGFENGVQLIVKDWDKQDVKDANSNSLIVDKDTYAAKRYAVAPNSATSKRIGYVVQSGNNKGTVMNVLGVSKSTLNSSNEDFEMNYLRQGQLVVSGGVYFTDGTVPVPQVLINQNVELAADTQQYVFDVVNTSILSDMEVNAWKNDLIKNAIHNK